MKDRQPLLVTHCASSASNGVTWGETIQAAMKYLERDPFEQAIAPAKLKGHSDNS
jgi:hypothetical protein